MAKKKGIFGTIKLTELLPLIQKIMANPENGIELIEHVAFKSLYFL